MVFRCVLMEEINCYTLLHWTVTLHEQLLKKMLMTGFTCLAEDCVFLHSSQLVVCCIIGKSWLVGGNWQVTKFGRSMGVEEGS